MRAAMKVGGGGDGEHDPAWRQRHLAGVPLAVRLVIYFLGGAGGLALGSLLYVETGAHPIGPAVVFLYGAVGVIFAFLGLPVLARELRRFDDFIRRADFSDLVAGVVGLGAGLVLAALLALFVKDFPGGPVISAILAVVFGWTGARVGLARSSEMAQLLGTPRGADLSRRRVSAAVLDTSVAVDGRIVEVLRTGFLDFALVVPGAVLTELQYLADSGDQGRRNRGRRGFDTLDRLQQLGSATVEFLPGDPDQPPRRVDATLLALAKRNGWAILTKDYNLARVARLEGVTVLNLHELSRALQPSAAPGEELVVTVVKEGREADQGVAYLEDGTMVVVERGRAHVGEVVAVTVTAVRQTSAGRLVFATLDGRPGSEPA